METLQRLREEVLEANLGIYLAGLVTMHSGNASGIDREHGRVVIKPSGMDYAKLTPEMLVVTDVEGRRISTGTAADRLNPSVDLPHHLYLYRNCADIGGIVHTHSNYATSFAVLNRPIPAYLTAIADEFGEKIPCAPYVDNVGDHIGEAILRHRTQSPAVLLAHHGAFTFGRDVKAALKAAVMLEDVAKTCYLALQLGTPSRLPAKEVRKWYYRYHTTYGQQNGGERKRRKPAPARLSAHEGQE